MAIHSGWKIGTVIRCCIEQWSFLLRVVAQRVHFFPGCNLMVSGPPRNHNDDLRTLFFPFFFLRPLSITRMRDASQQEKSRMMKATIGVESALFFHADNHDLPY